MPISSVEHISWEVPCPPSSTVPKSMARWRDPPSISCPLPPYASARARTPPQPRTRLCPSPGTPTWSPPRRRAHRLAGTGGDPSRTGSAPGRQPRGSGSARSHPARGTRGSHRRTRGTSRGRRTAQGVRHVRTPPEEGRDARAPPRRLSLPRRPRGSAASRPRARPAPVAAAEPAVEDAVAPEAPPEVPTGRPTGPPVQLDLIAPPAPPAAPTPRRGRGPRAACPARGERERACVRRVAGPRRRGHASPPPRATPRRCPPTSRSPSPGRQQAEAAARGHWSCRPGRRESEAEDWQIRHREAQQSIEELLDERRSSAEGRSPSSTRPCTPSPTSATSWSPRSTR